MPSVIEGEDHIQNAFQNGLDDCDEELGSLREQLGRLRDELAITAAERDHLRAQTVRQDEQNQLYQNQGSPGSQRPEHSQLRGISKAKRVVDPRIGRPKRILVVGGGPAGLISLHELLSPFNRPDGESLEGYQIELYERRAEIGGVWYFEPENDIAKGWYHGGTVLHTQHGDDGESLGSSTKDYDSGRTTRQHTHQTNSSTSGMTLNGDHYPRKSSGAIGNFCYLSHPRTAPRWPSPAYEGLVGNVLPPLLEFSAERFPKPKHGLFPSMTETHEYLLKIGRPLRSHIKTCMEVVGIKPVFRAAEDLATWQVESIDWNHRGSGAHAIEEWDAIVVAAGAFDHPYWPDVPGLAALREKNSHLVMHAKSYPGPRPFVNQRNKFVVVGNANSANDIAAHLAPLNSDGPLYRCIRHESNFAHLKDDRIKDVEPIASIREDQGTLSLTLKDGTVIDGVTKVIFASGYQFAFDWLSVPSIKDGERDRLVPSSFHGAVPNLHNTTFHAVAPTLAFIGLSTGSTPMPLAEIQARTTARTFYGLSKLPSTKDGMLAGYLERVKELGLRDEDGDAWRTLHMIRGPAERVITQRLLDELEAGENGASAGLFRWDEWREGIAKTMRSVKEGELRRLREAMVAAGGVDGGIGGVLSHGLSVGQKISPVFGEKTQNATTSLLL